MILNHNLIKLLKVFTEFQLYARETGSLCYFGQTKFVIMNMILDEQLIIIDDIQNDNIKTLFKSKLCHECCICVPIYNDNYLKPVYLYIGVSSLGIHFCFEYGDDVSSNKILEVFNTAIHLHSFFGDVLNEYESINYNIFKKIGYVDDNVFLIENKEMLDNFKFNIDYKYNVDELFSRYDFNELFFPIIIKVKSINDDGHHELDLSIITDRTIDKIKQLLLKDEQ